MGIMIKTEFGNAIISNGYLRLIPTGELVHRKIYEKYIGKIPEGYQIHHINEDKLDNSLENIVCLSCSEHRKVHMTGEKNPMYGKHLSDEAKKKISMANTGLVRSEEAKMKVSRANKGRTMSKEFCEAMSLRKKGMKFSDKWKQNLSKSTNSSGFYRVGKHKGKSFKQGFTWRYTYYEDGNYTDICSVNLLKLKKRVIEKGFDWVILDEEKAKLTAESVGLTLDDLR